MVMLTQAFVVPKTSISDLLHLNDKYQFLDTQLPPRVENAFHAVALYVLSAICTHATFKAL